MKYKKKVELEEANTIAEKMKEIKVVLKAKAGENGKTFRICNIKRRSRGAYFTTPHQT